jgi:sugar phosphate isomerase/epimerase
MTKTFPTPELHKRIGISNNLFLRDPKPMELIKRLAGEFQYVELEIEGSLKKHSNEITDFKVAEEIRKISEETGSTINFHAPYVKVDYLSKDSKQEAWSLLLRCAEFCAIAGAKTMTFHPGFRFSNKDEKVRQEAINAIENISYDLFSAVKALGSDLEFCLENMGNERPFLVLTEKEQCDIFSRAPVALTLDIVHAASFFDNQQDALDYIARMALHVKNVHLANQRFPKHVHLPLDKGDFDIDAALKILEDNGYDGPYIVEEIGGGFKPNEYLEATRAYRKKLAAQEDKVLAA